jgi:hypothetical protein
LPSPKGSPAFTKAKACGYSPQKLLTLGRDQDEFVPVFTYPNFSHLCIFVFEKYGTDFKKICPKML